MRLLSIGHGNQTIDALVALLRQHGVQLVVDVRSQPYSRYCPQFNREPLARRLVAEGIRYEYLGEPLGGRPADRALYLPNGTPDYARIAQTRVYQQGIARLIDLARGSTVVMMCSEQDFHECHRHKLIAPSLLEHGVTVEHIQPDGSLAANPPRQLSLFPLP